MIPLRKGIHQDIEASRHMPGPDGHHVFGAPGHKMPEESVYSGAPLFVDVRFLVGALVPEVLEGEENCLELEQVYV